MGKRATKYVWPDSRYRSNVICNPRANQRQVDGRTRRISTATSIRNSSLVLFSFIQEAYNRIMVTNDLLIDAFGRIKEEVHHAVNGLDDDRLLYRPNGSGNSIAWLIWHLARIQDDHMAELAEHEQVWTTESWYDKFGLPFDKSATGFGQSSEEVSDVKATTELLTGYYDAVHEKTIEFIKTLDDKDYQKIVNTRWVRPVS